MSGNQRMYPSNSYVQGMSGTSGGNFPGTVPYSHPSNPSGMGMQPPSANHQVPGMTGQMGKMNIGKMLSLLLCLQEFVRLCSEAGCV